MKIFTVEKANKLIPKVKAELDEIELINKKIAILRNEMRWLDDFWKESLRDIDNPDSDKYDRHAATIDKLRNRIGRCIVRIEKMGCVVRDLDAGFVDFYSTVNGRLAFLCWRYGEDEIRHWHPLSTGSRNRQPMNRINQTE